MVTGAIALVGAIGMLISRNAVHSALFLLLNFGAVGVLYLLLHAPFLFAIQLSIYAGAIMVLFLFVVMLLGAEKGEEEPDTIAWQRPVAIVLGLILLAEAIIVGVRRASGELGKELFTTYLLPFEITGVLLLVAIVGVVVLSRGQRETQQAEETVG
jgi:NADH-quinone oxidoreductase subunit J